MSQAWAERQRRTNRLVRKIAAHVLPLEPSGDRFVKHTHWLRPQTTIPGLWLTGQDSFSAGFAGSMMSSRITYAAITNDWLFTLSK